MKFAIIMVVVAMVMSPSWDQVGGSGGITVPERKPLAGWHQQGGWSGVQGGGLFQYWMKLFMNAAQPSSALERRRATAARCRTGTDRLRAIIQSLIDCKIGRFIFKLEVRCNWMLQEAARMS